MSHSWRNFKVVSYALLGSGVMGIGVSLLFNLDQLVIMPFFPDVLDAACIIAAGLLLIREMLKEASQSNVSKIHAGKLN